MQGAVRIQHARSAGSFGWVDVDLLATDGFITGCRSSGLGQVKIDTPLIARAVQELINKDHISEGASSG